MAALVQSFPQQSSTMTMLQARPTSASGHFQQQAPSQQQRSPTPRSMYNTGNSNGYRAQTSTAPVAPYAFTSTPSLANNNPNPLRQNPTTPYLRQENRSVSAPSAAMAPSSGFQPPKSSRSSVVIDSINTARPDASTQVAPSLPSPSLDLSLSDPRLASPSTAKPVPDRYRRTNRTSQGPSTLGSPVNGGSASPSGSGMAAVGPLYNHPAQSLSSPALRRDDGSRRVSKDDSVLTSPTSDQVRKYRRRSISGLGGQQEPQVSAAPPPMLRSYASVVSTPYTPDKRDVRPVNLAPQVSSSHGRHGSEDSVSSRSASRPSSVRLLQNF